MKKPEEVTKEKYQIIKDAPAKDVRTVLQNTGSLQETSIAFSLSPETIIKNYIQPYGLHNLIKYF